MYTLKHNTSGTDTVSKMVNLRNVIVQGTDYVYCDTAHKLLTTRFILTTIHHSYVLRDHLNLMNTVLFIQN